MLIGRLLVDINAVPPVDLISAAFGQNLSLVIEVREYAHECKIALAVSDSAWSGHQYAEKRP
jgi:hypothetical protein